MHKLIKTIFKNQLYFLLFISIWFCIDTNFENILSLKNNISTRNIFLFIRAILPIFLFATLFFIMTINKNYQLYFSTKNKSLNLILFLFSIFFIIQVYGLIVTKNNINNSYYVIVALITIICTLYSYNQNLEKISYFICLLFIGLVITVYSYLNYKWLLTTHNLQLYGTFPTVYLSLEVFSNNVIRSSGLSRSSLIFLIPVFFTLLIGRAKLIYLIVYFVLATNIYLTQSRTVLLFYIPFVCFAIFYFLRNENIKYIFKKFIILFVLPIVFFNSLLIVKEEVRTGALTKKFISFISKNTTIKEETLSTVKKEEKTELEKHYGKKFIQEGCLDLSKKHGLHDNRDPNYIYDQAYELKCSRLSQREKKEFYSGKLVRALDPKSMTSNRFNYWTDIISLSERPVTGYGALGDRFLIYQNSHNALIYSYASGGIISVVLILILILRYTYLCIFLVFFKKITMKKENIIILSSIFTLSFLIFRGITQVSIAVFSIDFLVFITCAAICEGYKKIKLN